MNGLRQHDGIVALKTVPYMTVVVKRRHRRLKVDSTSSAYGRADSQSKQ